MRKKHCHLDTELAQLVVAAVAIEFGVPGTKVLSPHKGSSSHSFARQVSMYLVHVVFQINLSRVARVFNRDRSTVTHACHIIEDCREDGVLDEKLSRLEAFLKEAPLPAVA